MACSLQGVFFVRKCFWLLSLGAFALAVCGPASVLSQPEPEAETPPVEDAELAETLRERLAKVSGLQEVEVEVTGGVVTLRGKVSESGSRSVAEDIARAQEGVVELRNELVLGGDVSERIGGALDRSLLKLKMLVGYLPLFFVAALVVAFFGLLSRVLASKALVRRMVGGNRFLQEVGRQVVRIGVFLVGLVIALDLLDATALVGAVFGAAGLAGLAIGFAFRDLIENYVASVLLSLRRPFQPNDHVVIDGHEGKVISLNTRATVLMTLDGNHLRLPNSLVFKSVTLNYTRNAERRFDFVVGVGVNEDLVAAQSIGVDTLDSLTGVLKEPPPWATITALADSSVSVQFFAWVDQTRFDFAKVKGEAIRLVKTALESAGMDLPEPIHRVRIEGNVEAASERTRGARVDEARDRARASQLSPKDLSPDRSLDRQIVEESEKARDTNLLSGDAPPE